MKPQPRLFLKSQLNQQLRKRPRRPITPDDFHCIIPKPKYFTLHSETFTVSLSPDQAIYLLAKYLIHILTKKISKPL